jgi:hypothetical protein
VFSFFTGAGLSQVGGWHPRFAEFRRWGHTEHSYRFYRAGLAPAPFNVCRELTDGCVWHLHPAVTNPTLLPADEEEIVAPERALIDSELLHFPVVTLSSYEFNGVPFGTLGRLGATVGGSERYPLVAPSERRRCRSDYQLGRFRAAGSPLGRAAALLRAVWQWPSNPMTRRTIKLALTRD